MLRIQLDILANFMLKYLSDEKGRGDRSTVKGSKMNAQLSPTLQYGSYCAPSVKPKRIAFCHPHKASSNKVENFAQHNGIDLIYARSSSELRNISLDYSTTPIILNCDLSDESGYLTGAKLKLQHPTAKVILITNNFNVVNQRFAQFIGADLCWDRDHELQELLSSLFG